MFKKRVLSTALCGLTVTAMLLGNSILPLASTDEQPSTPEIVQNNQNQAPENTHNEKQPTNKNETDNPDSNPPETAAESATSPKNSEQEAKGAVLPAAADTVVGSGTDRAAGEQVNFADANLEKIVLEYGKKKNWVAQTASHISREEAEKFTELQIDDVYRNPVISSLKGLEAFVNLTDLGISCTAKVSDYSPLAALVNLRSISIYYTAYKDFPGLKDISFIRGLTLLNKVSLTANRIDNIEPLNTLADLKVLNLFDNKIKNLTPMRNAAYSTYLTDLKLDFNGLSNLAGIENLTNLQRLELQGNKIRDISPLANLSQLNYIDLEENYLQDIEAFRRFACRHHKVNLMLSDNQILDITPVKDMYIDANPNGGWAQVFASALDDQYTAIFPKCRCYNLDDLEFEAKKVKVKQSTGNLCYWESENENLTREEIRQAFSFEGDKVIFKLPNNLRNNDYDAIYFSWRKKRVYGNFVPNHEASYSVDYFVHLVRDIKVNYSRDNKPQEVEEGSDLKSNLPYFTDAQGKALETEVESYAIYDPEGKFTWAKISADGQITGKLPSKYRVGQRITIPIAISHYNYRRIGYTKGKKQMAHYTFVVTEKKVNITAKPLKKKQYEKLTLAELKDQLENLPADSQVELKEEVKLDKAGQTQATLIVKYQLAGKEVSSEVVVPITVEAVEKPEIKTGTLKKKVGEHVTLNELKAQLQLKDETKKLIQGIYLGEEPDCSKPGKTQAELMILYKNGQQETVKVPIEVEAEKNPNPAQPEPAEPNLTEAKTKVKKQLESALQSGKLNKSDADDLQKRLNSTSKSEDVFKVLSDMIDKMIATPNSCPDKGKGDPGSTPGQGGGTQDHGSTPGTGDPGSTPGQGGGTQDHGSTPGTGNPGSTPGQGGGTASLAADTNQKDDLSYNNSYLSESESGNENEEAQETERTDKLGTVARTGEIAGLNAYALLSLLSVFVLKKIKDKFSK